MSLTACYDTDCLLMDHLMYHDKARLATTCHQWWETHGWLCQQIASCRKQRLLIDACRHGRLRLVQELVPILAEDTKNHQLEKCIMSALYNNQIVVFQWLITMMEPCKIQIQINKIRPYQLLEAHAYKTFLFLTTYEPYVISCVEHKSYVNLLLTQKLSVPLLDCVHYGLEKIMMGRIVRWFHYKDVVKTLITRAIVTNDLPLCQRVIALHTSFFGNLHKLDMLSICKNIRHKDILLWFLGLMPTGFMTGELLVLHFIRACRMDLAECTMQYFSDMTKAIFMYVYRFLDAAAETKKLGVFQRTVTMCAKISPDKYWICIHGEQIFNTCMYKNPRCARWWCYKLIQWKHPINAHVIHQELQRTKWRQHDEDIEWLHHVLSKINNTWYKRMAFWMSNKN